MSLTAFLIAGKKKRARDAERYFASLDEHRGIARAVFTGNVDLAVKRLEKHIEYGKQSLTAPRRP